MVFFIFIQNLINIMYTISGNLDQTPRPASSDLCLHCLSMPLIRTLGLYELEMSNFCQTKIIK